MVLVVVGALNAYRLDTFSRIQDVHHILSNSLNRVGSNEGIVDMKFAKSGDTFENCLPRVRIELTTFRWLVL